MKRILSMALAIVIACPIVAAAQTVGKSFPDFQVSDAISKKKVSLSGLRGKAVLIDFWATWCGPCVAELPNVSKAYDAYHKKGFEIVSISLDNEKDRAKFESFVKDRKMTWWHVMDGGGWQAALAKKHGINSIPAMFLLDANGKCVADNSTLRGEGKLNAAIEKTLKNVPPYGPGGQLDKADSLYAKKEYAAALKEYEKVAKANKDSAVGKKAAEKVKSIKADKEIYGAIMKAEADKQAPKLIQMASDMAEAGKPDQARKYYKQVVDKYPGTEHAEKAQSAMDKLGE